MRTPASTDTIHHEQLHDARRRLTLAQIHNAAARDAGVPAPWPTKSLEALEQAVINLTSEPAEDGAEPRTG